MKVSLNKILRVSICLIVLLAFRSEACLFGSGEDAPKCECAKHVRSEDGSLVCAPSYCGKKQCMPDGNCCTTPNRDKSECCDKIGNGVGLDGKCCPKLDKSTCQNGTKKDANDCTICKTCEEADMLKCDDGSCHDKCKDTENFNSQTCTCECEFGEDTQGNCCSEEVTPAKCTSGETKQDGDCTICKTCEDMGMTTCGSLCCDNGCDDTGNACKSACEDTVCPNGIAVKNYITGKDGPQNCVCCNNSNGETYVGAIDGQCCGGEAGFKTEMTPTYTVELQYSYSLTSDSGDHCCSTAVTETHNMSDGSTTSSWTLCFGSTCEC